jgi:hypothetical protein
MALSKSLPLAALFILLQVSTVAAAELKSKEPLKLRVGHTREGAITIMRDIGKSDWRITTAPSLTNTSARL